MGVHRDVLKSDKIYLDLYYLEVFAPNGHSQVNSWTFLSWFFLIWILLMIMNPVSKFLDFVMVLLALDTPNEYESNKHRYGYCPGVHTELC